MISLKNSYEIQLIRLAGKIAFLTHKELKKHIKAGITTKELDMIADSFIRRYGAIPSFKGYNGFPASICISVNEELTHGIPSSRLLYEGDIISIDIGVLMDGYHADTAWTYPVGKISNDAKNLLKVSEESLLEGIKQIKSGIHLSNISHAIQKHVEKNNYSIVRDFFGHGIGKELHEEPQIPNYGTSGNGPILKAGMVLAIEPLVNQGLRYVKTLLNNWTVVTNDCKLCAHYEHTIVVTETGYEILTEL